MTDLTKREESQKRRREYIRRNAPWLLSIYCFLVGVLLTNAFYQLLLVGVPDWKEALISICFLALPGSLAYEAFDALKRREDGRD